MGFGGGGSTITLPHTHDSNIVQDGGSLAANVTQFGLSAGSVLYSDGSNIQELSVGSSLDVLTVNGAATAPEWAAAGGGATLVRGTGFSTSSQTTTSTAMVTITGCTYTISSSDSGYAVILYNSTIGDFTNTSAYRILLGTDGGTPEVTVKASSTSYPVSINVISATLSSQLVSAQFRLKGAGTAYNGVDGNNSNLYVLEIS